MLGFIVLRFYFAAAHRFEEKLAALRRKRRRPAFR